MRDGWPARLQGVHLKAGQLRKMYNDYGEPETLLAREFDLDQSRLIYEMADLWESRSPKSVMSVQARTPTRRRRAVLPANSKRN